MVCSPQTPALLGATCSTTFNQSPSGLHPDEEPGPVARSNRCFGHCSGPDRAAAERLDPHVAEPSVCPRYIDSKPPRARRPVTFPVAQALGSAGNRRRPQPVLASDTSRDRRRRLVPDFAIRQRPPEPLDALTGNSRFMQAELLQVSQSPQVLQAIVRDLGAIKAEHLQRFMSFKCFRSSR